MPKKKTKTANTSKRRTKTKALGAARDLGAAETKKVRGGVIAIIAAQTAATKRKTSCQRRIRKQRSPPSDVPKSKNWVLRKIWTQPRRKRCGAEYTLAGSTSSWPTVPSGLFRPLFRTARPTLYSTLQRSRALPQYLRGLTPRVIRDAGQLFFWQMPVPVRSGRAE